MTKSNLSFSK